MLFGIQVCALFIPQSFWTGYAQREAYEHETDEELKRKREVYRSFNAERFKEQLNAASSPKAVPHWVTTWLVVTEHADAVSSEFPW